MMTKNKIDISGDGGVLKEILVNGVGDETPTAGCKISLHYVGKLADGKIFDTSVERQTPFEFDLGKESVIKCLELGASTMKKGEKCILTSNSLYGFGASGSPPSVPPNATLTFELEMLGWKGEDLSPNKDGKIERFVVVKSSKRKTPNDGAHVKIHITGQYDGNTFEDREVDFDVGEGSERGIIEGVEIAILKICIGEVSRLVIHPKYAFGESGNSTLGIPPNAVVEYVVSLKECEKAVVEWRLDKDESLAQAKLFKEKGNNYLKLGKYNLAIKMYKKSNNYLSNCDNEESQKTKIAIHLNIALCNKSIGEIFEAKMACNRVLELDACNIKGLYRRGQCYLALNDYENALKDFQKTNELDPENKAAANQITICKKKIKEFNEKEKRVYANMFAKFAAVDDHKENSDRDEELDILSSCGEWTEEEALKQLDKAFERDNNIVLLN